MSHSHAQSSRPEPMEVDLSRGQNQYKYRRVNSANPTQNLRQVKCWNCGMFGHISWKCRPNDRPRPPTGHGRPRQSNFTKQEN